MLAGYVYAGIHNKIPQLFEGDYYYATILEKPIPKEKTFKAELRIAQVTNSNKYYQTSERIIAYFEKDTLIKHFNAGDKLLFNSKPGNYQKTMATHLNIDYKNFLVRKRIFRQVYIQSENYKRAPSTSSKPIGIIAKQVREKATCNI